MIGESSGGEAQFKRAHRRVNMCRDGFGTILRIWLNGLKIGQFQPTKNAVPQYWAKYETLAGTFLSTKHYGPRPFSNPTQS
jgi:hypothetical protein